MKPNFKFLLVLILFIGCKTHRIISDDSKIFSKADMSDSLKFYFPESLNTKSVRNPKFDNFSQNWYSSALYSFKESRLFIKTDSETIYRFLWLRSFHLPVCYSLKKYNNEYYLNTKMLDRSPRSFEWVIEKVINNKTVLDTLKADRLAYIQFNETIKIRESEWIQFEAILNKSNYWNLASIDRSDDSTDGSEWILEGYKEKKYHFVDRHNFHELRESGMYLINLSNLKIPKNEIY